MTYLSLNSTISIACSSSHLQAQNVTKVPRMDDQTLNALTIAAITLSGVGFVFQVFLCVSVFNLFVKIRRIQRTLDHLATMKIVDSSNTDSLPLSLPHTPRPGEAITMLYRYDENALPTVNTEGMPQQTDTITEHNNNEAFENNDE